ncbi:hypothetical protein M231_06428 [Tremella mesenterica]|uniref:Uncharacterized protein n=1 Tax=Tremella mesenterica TaxID=5217 RepID=A0A4Q1BBU5_TREME|nr:hypothetical protein M231_06428 [Tremella mesenterica]
MFIDVEEFGKPLTQSSTSSENYMIKVPNLAFSTHQSNYQTGKLSARLAEMRNSRQPSDERGTISTSTSGLHESDDAMIEVRHSEDRSFDEGKLAVDKHPTSPMFIDVGDFGKPFNQPSTRSENYIIEVRHSEEKRIEAVREALSNGYKLGMAPSIKSYTESHSNVGSSGHTEDEREEGQIDEEDDQIWVKQMNPSSPPGIDGFQLKPITTGDTNTFEEVGHGSRTDMKNDVGESGSDVQREMREDHWEPSIEDGEETAEVITTSPESEAESDHRRMPSIRNVNPPQLSVDMGSKFSMEYLLSHFQIPIPDQSQNTEGSDPLPTSHQTSPRKFGRVVSTKMTPSLSERSTRVSALSELLISVTKQSSKQRSFSSTDQSNERDVPFSMLPRSSTNFHRAKRIELSSSFGINTDDLPQTTNTVNTSGTNGNPTTDNSTTYSYPKVTLASFDPNEKSYYQTSGQDTKAKSWWRKPFPSRRPQIRSSFSGNEPPMTSRWKSVWQGENSRKFFGLPSRMMTALTRGTKVGPTTWATSRFAGASRRFFSPRV